MHHMFASYLCIIFSVGMVMGRLFRVILAEHGGLHETKRKSTVVGETSNGHGEDSIEMMEFYNEEEGGENLLENTLVEAEAGTAQKRDPAVHAENV